MTMIGSSTPKMVSRERSQERAREYNRRKLAEMREFADSESERRGSVQVGRDALLNGASFLSQSVVSVAQGLTGFAQGLLGGLTSLLHRH
jgi:hypothetical protein